MYISKRRRRKSFNCFNLLQFSFLIKQGTTLSIKCYIMSESFNWIISQLFLFHSAIRRQIFNIYSLLLSSGITEIWKIFIAFAVRSIYRQIGEKFILLQATHNLSLSLGYRNNCFYGKEEFELNLFFRYLLLTIVYCIDDRQSSNKMQFNNGGNTKVLSIEWMCIEYCLWIAW